MIAFATDAPIYHRPIATIGLIVACTLLPLAMPPGEKNINVGGVVDEPLIELDPALGLDPPRNWAADDFADPDAEDDAEEAIEIDVPVRRRSGGWSRFSLRLQLGSWNPVQWFTSPLLHDSVFAWLFNMIALWSFGLVVEGKIGSLRFLGLFFGIAAINAAAIQTLFVLHPGGEEIGGATAAVLGLLGVACAWAPKNNFDVWMFYFGFFEIPIFIYGFIEFAFCVLSLEASSYISAGGILIGLAVGLIWVKNKWVDCENWDLIHVWNNQHDRPARTEDDKDLEEEAQKLIRSSKKKSGNQSATAPASQESERPPKRAKRRSSKKSAQRKGHSQASQEATNDPEPQATNTLSSDIEQLIEQGNIDTALKLLAKANSQGHQIELAQPTLARAMRTFLTAKDYGRAIPIMLEHIERFEVKRQAIQLSLAKIYLHDERPRKAISILKQVERSRLSQSEGGTWKQLVALAKKQIDEGAIEIDDS